MLSTFNLPSNNIDPNRQMAMMRTYLSQLKDELESELYNIGWNNLSKELREKISSFDKYSADTNEKVDRINANMVTADYLSANYLTANQITANYATITNLNAVSASVNSLSAIAITTNNLSAQTINANQITAGLIGASQLNASDIAANLFRSESLVASATAIGICTGTIVRATSQASVGNGGKLYFYNSGESDSVYLDYSRVKAILQAI